MTIQVKEMFARITPVYDRLNSLLSLGLVNSWRRAVLAEVPLEKQRILDCCAGTGELALLLARGGHEVIALDNCRAMLENAKQKAFARSLLRFIEGDAQELPFLNQSFQTVTNAFALRNIPDLKSTFSEAYRVLAPGGKAVYLELTAPPGLLKPFHALYLRMVLPLAGLLFACNYKAYAYLAKSIGRFHSRENIRELLQNSGFQTVKIKLLSGGIATLWSAIK